MLKFLRSFALAAAMLLPFAVQAQCDAITAFPWTEDFESMTASTVPTCWDNSASGSSTLSSYPERIWGVYSYGGNKMIRMYNYYVQSGTTLINTPTLALPTGESYELTFNYSHRASCGAFTVKVSTDGGSTFSDLQTYANTATNDQNNPGTFTETTISLAAYAGQSIILQFFATADYNAGSIFVDDIRVGAPPTCFKVTDLAVVSTQTPNSSLILSWSDATNASATYTVMNGTEVVASNVAGTSYTVTGLDANTDYTFSVIANCSATDASEAVIISARTACDPISTIPYSWDFESMTADAVPECWANVGAGNPYVKSSASNSHESSKYLDFRGSMSNLVVLPMTTVEANTLKMSLWLRPESTNSNCGSFSVGYVTDAFDASTFVALATYAYTEFVSGTSAAYGQREVMFESAPAGARMALRATPLTTNYYWYIDDVTIDVLPSCIPVSALTAGTVTSSSITLDWVSNASSFTILNMADGSVLGTSTTPTFTISGLDANTAYTFGVYVNCAGEESDTVTISTRTACGSIATLPYTMGFEEGDLQGTSNDLRFPFCWTRINTLTSGSNTYYPYSNSSTTSHGGSRQLYFYASGYGTYADTTGFVLPELDVTTYPMNANRVVFWAKGNATTPYAVIIGTMSDPADRSTFAAVDTLTINTSTYEKYIVLLADAPATDAYVAFLVPKAATSMYIDDLSLEVAPSCLDLAGFEVVSSTNNSITLSWSNPQNPGATYTLMNGTEQVATGITDTFYTVTGLTANTEYTFSVVANCSATDASPALTVTGRTACDAVAIPYTEGFEDADSYACWTLIDVANSTGRSTVNPNTGTNCFRFYYNTNPPQYLISPELAATTPLRLRFQYRKHTSGTETFKVGYSTSTIALADFTWTDEISDATTTYQLYTQTLPAGVKYVAIQYTANDQYYLFIDDLIVEELPSCLEPTGLALADMTASSLTFSWSGSAAGYTATLYDASNTVVGTPQTVTDTFCTFTGLTVGSTYTVKVVANCGSETSPEVSLAATLDYCTPNPTSVDGNGITGVAFGGMTNTTARPTAAPFYMNNTAMAGSVPAGTQASVEITYATGYDYGTVIWVDWNNNLMFDADEVVASGQSSSANPTTLTLSFTVPATTPVGSYRMRIAGADGYFDSYVNSGTGTPNPCFTSSYSVAEDYTLTVTEAPSCMPVSGLAVHAATDTSITLTWSDDNATATYTVLNGTEVVASNVADTFYTVTGLAANTEYTFAVVANCSATENSDTAYLTGRTACAAVALPYAYGFEEADMYSCWTTANADANTGRTYDSYGTGTMNGDYSFRFYYNTNPPQYLISPELTGTENGVAASFYYKNSSTSYTETFHVGYSTTDNDVNSFTWGEEISASTSQWTLFSEMMPAGTKYVAVKLTSNDQYYLYIDDVVFAAPATVTVASADATMGSVEPAGDSIVASGSEFTVTATPEQGYLFTAWLSGTDTVSTVNPFTFTVTGDTTLTAHFELGYATLTVASADATMGSVEPEGDTLVLIGSDIQLTATPAEHYHFVAWLAGTDTVSTDNPLTYTMAGDTTLTAHFAIDQHTVILSADATMGTVEPAGDSIVDYGTEFSATATAAEGYSFVAWLAGTDTVGTDATLVFTVESDTALTAVFSLNQYTVTLATVDAALGTVEPLGDTVVSHGSELVIEATAEEGAYFVAWLSGTDTVSLVNPLTVTVTSDSALTAHFALNQYTVTLASADAAMGIVVPAGDSIVDHGTEFTATAMPAMGHHFVAWLAGEDTVSTEAAYTFTVVSDTALVAAFEANPAGTFTVSVTYDETMGTVEGIPTGAVDSASVITLTAVPAEHYRFVSWSTGDTTATINVTVVSDTTLTATFALMQYTVAATVDPVESGSVDGIPTEAVDYGTTVTLVAVPAEGYHFVEWSNGVTTDTLDLLVESDTTVVAQFALNTYTVTTNVTPDASGSVNVSPAATVEHGTVVSLTAVPAAGYHFVSWSNGATEPTITVAVVSDTTLTATFEANAAGTYTVSVIYDATMGTVSGVPTEPVATGTLVTLVATANDGYVFTGWSNGTTSDTLVFTVVSDVTVTANFEAFVPVNFIVGVSTRNTTMGTVDPMGLHTVLEGTEFTATATANDGYRFVAWLTRFGGLASLDTVSTDAVYTFTVTASINLVAVFEPVVAPADLFLVTGEVNDATMGYVVGGGYYEAGTEVTLTAQANEGYRFVRWTDGLTDAYRTFTVTADVTYTAVFERAPVDIDDVEAAEVEIFAADGRIVVRGAESDIYLYDVNGRVLSRQAAAANVEFTVPATGVYLVKVGNAAAKRVAVVR